MFTYTQTNDFTVSKVKAAAKADVMTILTSFLKEKFGEENVKMTRNGKSTSPSNDLAVRFGTVDVDGEKVPICFTVSCPIKEYVDRQTAKTSYIAFDFDEAAKNYENHLIAQANKAKVDK